MQLSLADPGWTLFLLLTNGSVWGTFYFNICSGLSWTLVWTRVWSCGSPGSQHEVCEEQPVTLCPHTVPSSLPLPKGSCWLKVFFSQKAEVSHWFPQGRASLRQKAGASGLPHPPVRAAEAAREGCSPHIDHRLPFLLLECYWRSLPAGVASCYWRSLLESRTLREAPQLRQPQFILLSVFWSLTKTEISLICQDSSRIFP